MQDSRTPAHKASGMSRDQRIGVDAHILVTRLVTEFHPHLPSMGDLRREVRDLRGPAVGPAERGEQVAVVMLAAGYVRHGWPPPSWGLVETEATTRQRSWRPDIWWEATGGMLVADELKKAARPTAAMVEQAHRQLEAGITRWGDRVWGVRLFTAGDPGASLWCPPVGPPVPLVDTALFFDWAPVAEVRS